MKAIMDHTQGDDVCESDGVLIDCASAALWRVCQRYETTVEYVRYFPTDYIAPILL